MSDTTVSRRRAMALAGAGVAGIAGAAAVGGAVARQAAGASEGQAAGAVPFHGRNQAGIVTPAQDRLHFVAFDVVTKDRSALVRMLKDWTAAAARMTSGKDAGTVGATA